MLDDEKAYDTDRTAKDWLKPSRLRLSRHADTHTHTHAHRELGHTTQLSFLRTGAQLADVNVGALQGAVASPEKHDWSALINSEITASLGV